MQPDVIELLKTLDHKESEICEFKINNYRPELIGESISALSNAAAVSGVDSAYLLFGIDDNGKIVGTNFNPDKKHKNQELKNWLATQLKPATHFTIDTVESCGKRIVIFTIAAASTYPVKFKSQARIRVGSYTKSLNNHPDLEKVLWQNLSQQTFETTVALDDLDRQEVLDKLDYEKYFELRKDNIEPSSEKIIERLKAGKCIKYSRGRYSITNLGALLMAKNIGDFYALQRKVPRLVVYRNKGRLHAIKDITISEGYISCIPQIMEHIFSILPYNEEIKQVFRVEKKLYPEEALRELIVNSLIHQDFRSTGADPMIEIFPDRIEIRNLGRPLIEVGRFIDEAKSRNELLVREMRLLNFCEERGSGIDRVLLACEFYQLPPPLITANESSTTVVIYAPQKLSQMNKADKIRACYLHACLKFVGNEVMTNKSLRERLVIAPSNYPSVSRIIRDTLDAGLIKKDSDSQMNHPKGYVPYWGQTPSA